MRSPGRDATTGRGRRGIPALAAAAAGVCGVAAITVALATQHHPPQPPPSAAGTTSSGPATTRGAPTRAAHRPSPKDAALPPSAPTSIAIPKIDVHSSLLQLGRSRDGTIQVPPRGPDYDKAAWYDASPTPGQLGASVIEGHIDSARHGPSVFYKLGALRPGDTVSVHRADGRTAVFRIDGVRRYPKTRFPTLAVYGDTDKPALRLVTCGGSFDSGTGHYRDNIIAFATLTASHST